MDAKQGLSLGRSNVKFDVIRLEASHLLFVLVVDISKDGVCALKENMLANGIETPRDNIPVVSA